MVKDLYAKVWQHIKKNKQYAYKANKERKLLRFELEDWVWVHIQKEKLPKQIKSKLMPREDGSFHITKKINNNAYKVDLLGEYEVSATFNVSDLSLFDVGWDDTIQLIPKKSVVVLVGPITRAKAKKFKEAFNRLL